MGPSLALLTGSEEDVTVGGKPTPSAIRRAWATAAGVVVLAGCALVSPAPQPTSTADPATAPTPVQGSGAERPAEAPQQVPAVVGQDTLLPDPGLLGDALGSVSRKGIGVSGMVVLDPATGQTLASRGDRALVPASSMKVVTAATVLSALGPQARFTTSVALGDGDRIVLVGGGDPLLTDSASNSAAKQASLEQLARRTAAALVASGTTKVALGYDESLFTGPAWNAEWKRSWRSYIPQVSALTVDEGGYNPWQAHPDPAAVAAQAFAARLRERGVRVTSVAPASAAGLPTLAGVESAPLETIVKRMLRISDNVTAEILARQAALAGGAEASFAGATATATAWLQDHGLWHEGMRLTDGSGLSAATRVTPSALAGTIAVALGDPTLAALVGGLPVAGVNGTLANRFNDPSEKAGRRVVHAKTGTLAGVSSLTGYLTTRDGATVVFSAIANRAVGQTTAYNWLDRSAATLARCGCSTPG